MKRWSLICTLILATACGSPPAAKHAAGPQPPVPASQPAPDPEQCLRQHQGVREALQANDGKRLHHRIKQLVVFYGQLRDGKTAPAAALSRCKKVVAGTLRELATSWHREAQKSRDNSAYEPAERLYELYLSTFPQAADLREMTFYHAEVLYKLSRWDQAAAAYTRVVQLSPADRRAREAAFAALISLKQVLNARDEVSAPRSRRDPNKPRKLSSDHRRFVAAIQSYLQLVPNAPERQALLYRRARIYYSHNLHDQAVKGFAALVNAHPDHELAVYAANLLLDSLNAQRKYAELERWVRRMLAEPRLAKGEFLVQLHTLDRGAQRKAAERLQKAKRHGDCGNKYLQIAARYPTDPRRPEVLYNAAICFEADRQLMRSIKVRQQLIKLHPQHRLAARALLMIAEAHDVLQQADLAAEHYERFVRLYPGEKQSPRALLRAMQLRHRGKQYQKLFADLASLHRYYGASRRLRSLVLEATLGVGQIHAQRGDHAASIRHYRRFLKKWAAGPRWRFRALVALAAAQWRSSCPLRRRAGHLACMRQARPRRGALPCEALPRVLRRRPAPVKQAHQLLARARKLHAQLRLLAPTPHSPGARLQRGVALARAYAARLQADMLHEPLLALKLPPAGKPRELLLQRLDAAREAYQQVIQQKQPPASLAATARLAQLEQALARARCHARDPGAARTQTRARTIFSRCAQLAQKWKLTPKNDPWARLCVTRESARQPAK